MQPIRKQNRDLVIIQAPVFRLQKYNVQISAQNSAQTKRENAGVLPLFTQYAKQSALQNAFQPYCQHAIVFRFLMLNLHKGLLRMKKY